MRRVDGDREKPSNNFKHGPPVVADIIAVS